MKTKSKLFIVISTMIIVPIILTVILSSFNFSVQSNELIESNLASAVESQSKNVNAFLEQQVNSLKELTSYSSMLNLLDDNIYNQYEYDKTLIYMQQLVQSKVERQSYIKLFCFANTAGRIILSSKGKLKDAKSMIENADKWSSENGYISNVNVFPEYSTEEQVVIIGVPVYLYDDFCGYMYQVISTSYLENFIINASPFKSCAYTIVDSNNAIASTNDKYLVNNKDSLTGDVDIKEIRNDVSNTFSFENNNSKRIGYLTKIPNCDFSIIGTAEWDELQTPVLNTILSMVVIIIIIVVILLFVIKGIYNLFTYPITTISKTIEKIGRGNYTTPCPYKKDDEFGVISNALNSLMNSVNEKTQKLEYANLKLKSITDNLPGGMIRCLNNEQLDIIYFNEGFLRLLNITSEELEEKYDNKLINVVYKQDRKYLNDTLTQQIEDSMKAELQYRICDKENNILWVHQRGSVVFDDKSSCLDFVLIDITEQKSAEESRLITESKYRLALETTNDAIFEADLKNDLLLSISKTLSADYSDEELITYSKIISIIAENEVHPNDKTMFMDNLSINNLIKKFNNNQAEFSCEFRKKNNYNNYTWMSCNIFFATNSSTVEDDNLIIIGCFKNIDEEKKSQLDLLRKAERDSLTDLSNKGTTENLVTQLLLEIDENTLAAMFIIDVDEFKLINDTLGHLKGDEALAIIANKLRSLFKTTDIIGRIGGDEFLVFIKGLNSIGEITKISELLISSFKDFHVGNAELKVKLSISVGVSICPEHGCLFKELMNKADLALYQSKTDGRNRYTVFNDELLSSKNQFNFNGDSKKEI